MRAARAGFRVFQNEFGQQQRCVRPTDRLKDEKAHSITYEDIAAVDCAISKSQERCKPLGVTYDQVWRQWSDETDATLPKLTKKADFWWHPGVPSGLLLSTPTVAAVWLTLLGGGSMCGLIAWFASSVAVGCIVIPIQRYERLSLYKDAITKRLILDRIAKCRQMGEATKKD